MRKFWATPLALAATCVLAAACSKPAEKTADNAGAAVADSASDAAAGPTAPGGAVSPPSADNGAVNTDANTTETGQSAASNSFTEDQARGHIEHAGYTDVSGLTKTADGMWTGQAKKDGKSVSVSVDFKGAVTSK
jgi:hypothetical protein